MTPGTGQVSTLLAKLGIGAGVDWSNTAIYAILMVVITDVWHAVGFNFVIISAGTKDISPDPSTRRRSWTAPCLAENAVYYHSPLGTDYVPEITYGFYQRALQVYDIP